MDKKHIQQTKDYYNYIAKDRDSWKKKNAYYHKKIEQLCQFITPKGVRVLEIGCGTGDLLHALKPQNGVGIDISNRMIELAKNKYRKHTFLTMAAENISLSEQFDYIILSDIIGNLDDIQKAFEEIHKVASAQTRIVITCHNYLWEPVLALGEKMGLKMPQPIQNWLSINDIQNLLDLANLDIVKKGTFLLLPIHIPVISDFVNKYIARLPLIKSLCLVQYFIVRLKPSGYSDKEYSVSVIIPARNEEGNIEKAIIEIPKLGNHTEIIFIEGHSRDNTLHEIKRVIKKYKNKRDIQFATQGKGIGKADAVRKGIAMAKGEIIVIFDADLTVSPYELPKFYQALRIGKGEYIQGSRLVYPMEKQAMRFLNIIGNKFFSLAFSWLLDQPIKDTLCGTKIIFRKDYIALAKNISYFGNFDPFGDFELTFGASKLNKKLIEIPIRYKARTYGSTNISRFRHGWLLLKMTFFAAKKLKFV